MPADIWEAATNAPSATHPLEKQTDLYVDLFMALRVLSMTYSQYMHHTSLRERRLYRLFLVLEQAKEEHQREKAEQFAEAEREANRGMVQPPRG